MEEKNLFFIKEKSIEKLSNQQLQEEIEKLVNKHNLKKEEMIKLLDKIEKYENELKEIEKRYSNALDILNLRLNGKKITDNIDKIE